MSIHRIYIRPEDIDTVIDIKDINVVHKTKNVLRLKINDKISIFDGKGKEFLYNVEIIKKDIITVKKEKLLKEYPMCKNRITLGFPLVKEEKISIILQKSTELGVHEFIPFVCQRSLKDEPSSKKKDRWDRIICEAARQSQRLWVPRIKGLVSFKDIVKFDYKLKLAASINGKTVGNYVNDDSCEILILVGPEGDFACSEYKLLEANCFKFIKLGANILRVETACIFSAGLVQYLIN